MMPCFRRISFLCEGQIEYFLSSTPDFRGGMYKHIPFSIRIGIIHGNIHRHIHGEEFELKNQYYSEKEDV